MVILGSDVFYYAGKICECKNLKQCSQCETETNRI